MQNSPTGASVVGSTLHVRKNRKGFFFSTHSSCPSPQAFVHNFSTETETPPPPTATLLLERQVFI